MKKIFTIENPVYPVKFVSFFLVVPGHKKI